MTRLTAIFMYLFIISFFNSRIKLASAFTPISFSQQNVYIKFKPPPLPNWKFKNSTEEELIQIVNKTSERFGNFFSSLSCADENSLELARATAIFNIKSKKHMTVVHLVEIYQKCGEKNEFEVALDLAREANAIYPETVQYIAIGGYLTFNSSELQVIFSLAKSQLEAENKNYKLALMLDITYCTDDALFNSIKLVLPIIDLIILVRHPQNQQYTEGVDYTAKLFYQQFQMCQKQMREISRSIQVGFSTRWSMFALDGKLKIKDQVDFWGRMNNWAITDNVKMFMYELFDESEGFDAKTEFGIGWLKQVRKGNDSEYKDKERLALEQAQAEDDGQIFTNKSGLLVYIGAPVGALVALIALSLLSYYVIKRRRLRTQLLSESELEAYWKELKKAKISFTEISQNDFTIITDICLGSGEFGKVYYATIKQYSENIDAAAKMPKSSSTEIVLRSLLSELKILATLGNHGNITRLLGAYMQEVRENKVFIFLELCQIGALEKYLRNVREVEIDEILGRNLLRWSYEISCGMEHVASKNIVHMDIATRNVLLSTNLTAKISDFGLSRRLYNYKMYTKKNLEPLPWKWMAPEALQKLLFTEKSDVWSFGITLWEIFSLGSLPYAGIQWDMNFFRHLEAGLRPREPNFNPGNIYNEVIQSCWDLNPVKRPSFGQLKSTLEIRLKTEFQVENLHSGDIRTSSGGIMTQCQSGVAIKGYWICNDH